MASPSVSRARNPRPTGCLQLSINARCSTGNLGVLRAKEGASYYNESTCFLRSSFAGSCIDRPPGGVRMASKALHAVRRRPYILWCWMDMQRDESDPAPPRPDLLRVGKDRSYDSEAMLAKL